MARMKKTPARPEISSLGNLRIERIKLSQMKPATYNPRVALSPGDPEYKRLRKSVLTFGYIDPMVWNVRTGNLVGGHQRYTVLFNENVKEADVSVVDLSDAEEKALNLALNKIKGRWDEEGLAAMLADLSADKSIDIALSGFDPREIDRLVNEGEQLVELILPQATPEDAEDVDDARTTKTRDSFRVSVECNTRKAQDRLFKKLTAEGYECRKVS